MLSNYQLRRQGKLNVVYFFHSSFLDCSCFSFIHAVFQILISVFLSTHSSKRFKTVTTTGPSTSSHSKYYHFSMRARSSKVIDKNYL